MRFLLVVTCGLALAGQPSLYRRVAGFRVPDLVGLPGRTSVWVEQPPESDSPRKNPPPARLCIDVTGGPACYLAVRERSPFSLDAQASAADLSSAPLRRNAILFTAGQNLGGSGTKTLVALLVYTPGDRALKNLLPPLVIREQCEYRLWADPQLSPHKFFTVSDFVWAEGEAHFSEHHYRVSTYAFSEREGGYVMVDDYTTQQKYPGLDSVQRTDVLQREEAAFRERLRNLRGHLP